MSQCQGRVFTRLNLYQSLPTETKREIEELEQFITANQAQIFEKHHPKLIKSVNGVKYKELVEKIDAHFNGNSNLGGATRATPGHDVLGATPGAHSIGEAGVQQQQQPPRQHGYATRSATMTQEPTMKDKAAHAMENITPGMPTGSHQATTTPHTMGTTQDKSTLAKQEAKAKVTGRAGDLHATGRSQRLVEGLVLKGFITPYKEDEVFNMNKHESFDFKDSDLFIPVAAQLSGLTERSTTVWDVAQGAIYANTIKRKANIIEKMVHGKDAYVVVDKHTHSVTLFDDDVSHKAIAQIQSAGAQMAEDASHFERGLKVWNDVDTEIFEPASKSELEVLVAALRDIGINGMNGVGIKRHPNDVAKMTGGHYTADHQRDATMHQQGYSTGTGAAHGDPANRMSQEPTMQDKYAHIKDKFAQDSQNAQAYEASHPPGADLHRREGGLILGQDGHGQQGYRAGAADGAPNHRMRAEPTMKDKAAHAVQNVQDKLTPGESTSHSQRVQGQGAPGMVTQDSTFDQRQGGVMPGINAYGDQTPTGQGFAGATTKTSADPTASREHFVAP